MSSASERLVIGVGHPERQDDGVGPYVAERLSRLGLPAVAHEGDGTGLLDLWAERRCCYLVDAMAGAAPAGSLVVFGGSQVGKLAAVPFVRSTHQLGVPEAVTLGRTLGRLPGHLVVIGITGCRFGFGAALSPAVRRSADGLVARLARALRRTSR